MLPMTLQFLIVMIASAINDRLQHWMKQVARNLTDSVDGFLRDAKYLIHDRDPLFTEAFEAILGKRGVEVRPGSTSQKGARGKVVCRSRLGGMLNFYAREAA